MEKVTFENRRIAIIGGGHMGLALAKGLALGGKVEPSQIWVADPMLPKIAHLKEYGIKVTTSNSLAVSNADIVFIVVKHLIVKEVVGEVKDLIRNKLLVSAAAALSIKSLKAMTHKDQKIVRIMPNLPVAYNEGVIGVFATNQVSGKEKIKLVKMLSSLGTVVNLKNEKELNTVTLISACGPAIVSSFFELMVSYAEEKKIPKETASKIVMRTFIGTLYYLNESEFLPSELIKFVATKGGITETILKKLDKDFKKNFVRAMEGGRIKIEKLTK